MWFFFPCHSGTPLGIVYILRVEFVYFYEELPPPFRLVHPVLVEVVYFHRFSSCQSEVSLPSLDLFPGFSCSAWFIIDPSPVLLGWISWL